MEANRGGIIYKPRMITVTFKGNFKIFKKTMAVKYNMSFCLFTNSHISTIAVHQFISAN